MAKFSKKTLTYFISFIILCLFSQKAIAEVNPNYVLSKSNYVFNKFNVKVRFSQMTSKAGKRYGPSFCHGGFITENVILTAAHCLPHGFGRLMIFKVGEDNNNLTVVLKPENIKSMSVHPGSILAEFDKHDDYVKLYKSRLNNVRDDIGLIILDNTKPFQIKMHAEGVDHEKKGAVLKNVPYRKLISKNSIPLLPSKDEAEELSRENNDFYFIILEDRDNPDDIIPNSDDFSDITFTGRILKMMMLDSNNALKLKIHPCESGDIMNYKNIPYKARDFHLCRTEGDKIYKGFSGGFLFAGDRDNLFLIGILSKEFNKIYPYYDWIEEEIRKYYPEEANFFRSNINVSHVSKSEKAPKGQLDNRKPKPGKLDEEPPVRHLPAFFPEPSQPGDTINPESTKLPKKPKPGKLDEDPPVRHLPVIFPEPSQPGDTINPESTKLPKKPISPEKTEIKGKNPCLQEGINRRDETNIGYKPCEPFIDNPITDDLLKLPNDRMPKGINNDGTYDSLFDTDGDMFAIKTFKGDKSYCLDVEANRVVDGSQVILYECHGNNNQHWIFDSKSKTIQTVRKSNNKRLCLDYNPDLKRMETRKCVVTNNKYRNKLSWKFYPKKGSKGGRLMYGSDIRGVQLTRLDIVDGDAKNMGRLFVNFSKAVKEDSDIWIIKQPSNAEFKRKYEVLRGQKPEGPKKDGSFNSLFDAQEYDFSISHYYDRTKNNSLCLDVKYGQFSPGNDIILYWCHGRANQKWTYDLNSGHIISKHIIGNNKFCLAYDEKADKLTINICMFNKENKPYEYALQEWDFIPNEFKNNPDDVYGVLFLRKYGNSKILGGKGNNAYVGSSISLEVNKDSKTSPANQHWYLYK